MPKVKAKKTQANHTEPFSAVAQRLGDALADTVSHPDCPAALAELICGFDSSVSNEFDNLAAKLRYCFAETVCHRA